MTVTTTCASPVNRPRQLHDAVIDQFGYDIVSGSMPAGTTMTVDVVAERLGVSRTVMREAVRVLESIRLIQIRRKVGISVLPPDAWNPYDANVIRWKLAGPQRAEHLGALTELCIATEPVAARLAAGHATVEQCAALASSVARMSGAARSSDFGALDELCVEFHRTVLKASGNPMFNALGPVVEAVLDRGRAAPAGTAHDSVRLLARVASSISLGDGPAAQAAMLAVVMTRYSASDIN
jgi:DNA-binding FadR family transcriptional regulator